MRKQRGFTLTEIMIVVLVVAILMAIALPGYQNYVRKARRSDGMDALLTIQNLQERYRANNPEYGALTDIGWGTDTESLEGHYTLSMALGTGTLTGIAYTVTATGDGDQANDEEDGTTCTLVVTVDATNPRGDKTPEDCW